MRNYRPVQNKELESIECDVCHKLYSDIIEIQEFLFIDTHGGYASVFGDMNKVQLDMCQHCTKDTLGKYIRIEETDE